MWKRILKIFLPVDIDLLLKFLVYVYDLALYKVMATEVIIFSTVNLYCRNYMISGYLEIAINWNLRSDKNPKTAIMSCSCESGLKT